MTETLLSYLTKSNPNLLPYAKPPSNFTFNSDWEPVESMREWTNFNYDTLHLRFRNELSRHVSAFPITRHCEDGGFNKIFDERGLSDLICMSIMGPVSAVLPSSFITSGGRVIQHVGCIPDWGAGKDEGTDQYGKAKALVLGDTKFNWSSINALNAAQNGFYEDSPFVDLVRPIEQVQYYGAVYGCRYAFIISDQELVVMQLHLAPAPVRTSPRPQRTRPPPSHQRVISSSTISKKLTDMSIDESYFKASIGLVEYKKIPWSATSGLTIKLALYCLIRLAAEDGNDLKIDYPRLTSLESSITQNLPSTAISSSQPRNSVPTSSTVASASASTPQTSNENEGQFYDTSVQWNKSRTGYVYKDNNGKWIFNDLTSDWSQIGDFIYNFKGNQPYPRSSIPH